MVKAVLLDIGGVVYVGEQALPGAADAVGKLFDAGLPLRCLTNTTRTPLKGIVARLRSMGVEIDGQDIFTPVRAARAWLDEHGRAPHLLVHADLVPEFDGLDGGTDRAVVIGDAADGFTYAALNAAFRELQAGADFLALAANRTFRDADGEISIDAGAFVAALEFASERKATVLGKPSAEFYKSAVATFDCAASEVAMIGDDAEADVAGALEAGVGTAVLVRTGKYAAGDEDAVSPPPSHVADDLAAAVEWLLER